MQPCYTHPSGLEVYAVDQDGNPFVYTYYDVGPGQPVPTVILDLTEPGQVIFHLVNTNHQRVAVYAVAMGYRGDLQFNVVDYEATSTRPPFQRELNTESNVIWIEPGATYDLCGMMRGPQRALTFPFFIIPSHFNDWSSFTGPDVIQMYWVSLRIYPGDNNPTRQAFDVDFGFKRLAKIL